MELYLIKTFRCTPERFYSVMKADKDNTLHLTRGQTVFFEDDILTILKPSDLYDLFPKTLFKLPKFKVSMTRKFDYISAVI